eukprot:CAMPEP_0117606598 /NCGR_PEP_ID=MMETSP0784-20121206/79793_1 /TAXON_ID=39447 /ORGANISM="" /LENGTH=264 /DNA_ID=CAMNT_0005409681 /DNA_START=21 /DNA_END=816 /DNA_ORIENTATION=+
MAVARHSKEVVRHAANGVGLNLLHWRWVKLQEGVLQVLVDFHHGSLVAAPIAVVWRREDRDHVAVVAPVVTLHDKLVCAGDELQSVRMVELLRDVLAESIAGAAWRDAQASRTWAPRAALPGCGQAAGCCQVNREMGDAAVHANDLIFNDGRHRQVVEGVRKDFPHVGAAVRTHALVEEAVDLRDLPALVVPAEERNALFVAHLVQEHQRDGLHRVVAAVDVVTEENVIRLGQRSAYAVQLFEVEELPVDVAAHCDRASHWLAV